MKHFKAPVTLFAVVFLLSACNTEKNVQKFAKPADLQLAGGFTPSVINNNIDTNKIALIEKEIPIIKNTEEQYRKTAKVSIEKPVFTAKSNIKKQEVLTKINKTLLANVSASKAQKIENKATNAGIVSGIILAIVGFFVLMFVSVLFGALIMILGFVFMIAGAAPSPSPPPPAQPVQQQQQQQPKQKILQDVVYLKNGSIIRGIILEQIINEQIKIQTKDGSVWVFKNEEIIKIVKEPELE